jgi:protein FrlC
MKFSFLSYLFCRFPLEYSFKMAARYGYAGVEVWGARPHAWAWDMDQDAITHLLAIKKQYGLEVSMFTPEILAYPYSLVSRLEKERLETVDYLIRSAEVAASLGTKKMQITAPHPGYGINRNAVWSQLVDGVGQLCNRAHALGIEVIMESLTPSEGNLITTAADLDQLIRDVSSPALKGMLDVVPPVIANEPFSEYFDRLGENFAYLHICNSDGQSEYHSQLNDGVIPLVELFALLQHYQYNGWCSLELLAPYFKDPELYLLESTRLIQDACFKLGLSNNLRIL